MDHVRRRVHRGAAIYDGSISGPPSPAGIGGSNLDAHQGRDPTQGAHAVEFSKTAAPCREGDSFSRGATDGRLPPARPPSIARVSPRLQEADSRDERLLSGRGL